MGVTPLRADNTRGAKERSFINFTAKKVYNSKQVYSSSTEHIASSFGCRLSGIFILLYILEPVAVYNNKTIATYWQVKHMKLIIFFHFYF